MWRGCKLRYLDIKCKMKHVFILSLFSITKDVLLCDGVMANISKYGKYSGSLLDMLLISLPSGGVVVSYYQHNSNLSKCLLISI